MSLQKITPIRGRKHEFVSLVFDTFNFILFTEDNPDKGTETVKKERFNRTPIANVYRR